MSLVTPHRTLVVYKPPASKHVEYYGPFVSRRLAEDFIANSLPDNANAAIRQLMPRQDYHDPEGVVS